MFKHTPTKWSRTRIDSLLRYGRKFDGPWCDNENDDGDMPTDFDTDLVTAAPDLLAACEAILDDGTPWAPDTPAMNKIRAAITKAKGGAA